MIYTGDLWDVAIETAYGMIEDIDFMTAIEILTDDPDVDLEEEELDSAAEILLNMFKKLDIRRPTLLGGDR